MEEDAWDVLERFKGSIEGPPDWSAEHDHYLYGTPKRSPTMDDDRAADARAEEDERTAYALGWTRVALAPIAPDDYSWRDPDGLIYSTLPAFGSDPAAARLLLEAVPEGKRREVVRALMEIIDAVPFDDDLWVWQALLAPPHHIRDAVLEVMGNE